MNQIQLFDSLIHTSDINIIDDMKKMNISNACVTDFLDINKTSYLEYFNKFTHCANIVPIAYLDSNLADIEQTLLDIKTIGYKGIKLHTRRSNTTLTDRKIDKIFKICSELNLVVFLCTYFYDNSIKMFENNFDNLVKLINSNTDTKIILLHGGSIEVLKYMELVRFNNNLLLDLSFTLCKYEGSSIDLDIKFLFEKFDRRICIGSDFPDFSFSELRRRFEYFAQDIHTEKQKNIAYKNLSVFLEMNNDFF